MKCRAKLLTGFKSAYCSILFGGINEEKAEKLYQELKKIDDVLGAGNKYVSGETFQYLDIVIYPHLERVLWMKDSVIGEYYTQCKIGELKNLRPYYERVREIEELKPVLCVPKAHYLIVKKFKEEGGAQLSLPVQLE